MSNNNGKFYTAYLVREANSRRFLNRRTYSGRLRGVWSKSEDAFIFYDRQKAQSCASNINARRPDNASSYYAQVVPVILRGRGTKSI